MLSAQSDQSDQSDRHTAPGAVVSGRVFHEDGSIPSGDEWVWVFGSNLRGKHGLGAAKVAHKNFGAQYGQGDGWTGRAYAIPTKARPTMDPRDVLPLAQIQERVEVFLSHARRHPARRFFITRVGCGLSGYSDAEIAPMFAAAPPNCSLPGPWRDLVPPGAQE